MDFAQGFELWRHLGKTGEGANLTFTALTAIHFAHRLLAYIVVAALALVAWQLHRGPLRTQARWIGGLVLWQFATGLSNVVLGWPLVAAISHTGGAAALVVVLTWTLCESTRARSAVLAARLPARELST